ncbi:MAG: ComF family protein [bacterium]
MECRKENKFGEFCPECKKNYFLDGIWAPGDYEDDTISKMVKNLKYYFAKDVAEELGKYMSQFLQSLIAKNILLPSPLAPKILLDIKSALIIPIPLHKKRLRWRGCNQSDEIANVIAKNFNLTINRNDLIRIKYQKAQAKLEINDRKENVKNSFAWRGEDLKNKNIILVDDVATTGSTLNEAARVLKENNAGEIWGLVVGS